MSRIGWKDRWKLRYAGVPRLRLGNNGKPWSTKISLPRGILHRRAAVSGIPQGELIFVPHGFPFFQAIQSTQFLEHLCNLRNLRLTLFRLPL
jgi:hypothetical protein